jgi:segregation and condensation protein A
MPYEIKTEQFSGPLEKLLELIEAEKLGINEVSLAKVTDGFLKYLGTFRGGGEGEEKFRVDLRILADFIAIASRLIFLKSKYLLPGLPLTEEEEADIKDLEERLKLYQQLKPALRHIGKLWRTSHRSFSRPYFLGRGAGFAAGQAFFYPGDGLDAGALNMALGHILETVQAYAFETETIKEKIITLEEKIAEVVGRMEREGDLQFRHLSDKKSRSEMIVLFLAILHLAREQLVLLEQMGNFSDIMVKKK